MNFKKFRSKLANLKPALTSARLRRSDIIFWGVMGLGVILAVLLVLDGYVFYQVFFGQRMETEIQRITDFPAEELNQLIKLLDERQEKLKEVLTL